jgi:hypothetical protein
VLFLPKVFSLALTIILLLTVCARPDSYNNPLKADNITVFYGVSSYAMFGAEPEVINKLLKQVNSLRFQETDADMDLASALHVNFSLNGKNVKRFLVDKNGVFWLDGEVKSYKIASGSFDYEYLKTVYEESKAKAGLARGSLKPELSQLNGWKFHLKGIGEQR